VKATTPEDFPPAVAVDPPADNPTEALKVSADECFQVGDGTGGREQNIGHANSQSQCLEMVRAQCPDANGATMPSSGSGSCYCEYSWVASNGSPSWQTCGDVVQATTLENVPPADTVNAPADTTTDPMQDAADECFQVGDGTGGREQNIGQANSQAQCLEMVRAQCPDANGATMPSSGSGGCYCEFSWAASNGSPSWQTCGDVVKATTPEDFPPADAVDPPADTASDASANAAAQCFQVGDGTGGPERNIGAANSQAQCLEMVRAQCPDATGATMPSSGSGGCYCEFSWASSNGSPSWQTCGDVVKATTPEDFPPAVAVDPPADNPTEALKVAADECFQVGDGTGGREQNIGQANSQSQCLEMVRAQCPDANGATMPSSGSGGCYCEYSWVASNGSPSWQTCGDVVKATNPTSDDASAVGDPHLITSSGKKADMCCDSGVCHPCKVALVGRSDTKLMHSSVSVKDSAKFQARHVKH